MSYEVEAKQPDLIIARLRGRLEPEDFRRLSVEMKGLMGDEGRARVLIDTTGLTDIPPRTRIAIVADRTPVAYSKLAVVSNNNRLRALGSLVIKMMPWIKSSQFFDDEAEALAWLES